METRRPNDGPDVTTFAIGYMIAWEAAGKPNQESVDSVMFDALDGKAPSLVAHHPLWVFMSASLQMNVPVNWFSEHSPAANRKNNISRKYRKLIEEAFLDTQQHSQE